MHGMLRGGLVLGYVLQSAGSRHLRACVAQVQRITNATLPLIDGFRNDLLASPVFVDASEIATSSPLLEDFFNTIGNFSSDLAPVLRAYTVHGHGHGPLKFSCRVWSATLFA